MVQDLDKVVDSCRRIARESLESVYSRSSKREGKIEIVDGRNRVEYN